MPYLLYHISETLDSICYFLILPYLVGWLVSSKVVSVFFFDTFLPTTDYDTDIFSLVVTEEECDRRLMELVRPETFSNMELVVHRNGEPNPCGTFQADWTLFRSAAQAFEYCPDVFDKYDVEALLTQWIASELVDACGPPSEDGDDGNDFLRYCDPGPDKVPELYDYSDLNLVPSSKTLPCRLHTREGLRISSLGQLQELLESSAASTTNTTCGSSNSSSLEEEEEETCSTLSSSLTGPSTSLLHVYAHPAGRMFMFAASHVGETFALRHVSGSNNDHDDDDHSGGGGNHVSLEVLSMSPLVFDVHNFVSKRQASGMIRRVLAETDSKRRLKTRPTLQSRSARRTADVGSDMFSKPAEEARRRAMGIMGYDDYTMGQREGIYIMRYNRTNAYEVHGDYVDDPHRKFKHDYDTLGKGGNRFATFLIYLSDMEEGDGGETVFVEGWPAGQSDEEHVPLEQALKELRESGYASMFDEGSWEEEMLAQCRTRLTIRPRVARVIMFYSLHPNGAIDRSSRHGGCPVLRGEKWVASLYIWSTRMHGYPGHPINEGYAKPVHVEFRNSGINPAYDKAQLFYGDGTFRGLLVPGHLSLSYKSASGQKWEARVDGSVVKSWTIDEEGGDRQHFVL